MPLTLYDKIWNDHLVHEQDDGTALLFVDRHLVHEVTSPQAFEGLRSSNRKVRQPSLTLAVADHNVPTTDRSAGIADKESLVINGKPKTNYNKKNEFKLESVIFKLDKGDVGSCPTDKKSGSHGGYPYAGRQEITHRLPVGHTIFETDIFIEGSPQHRTTVFQIHDGRNKGAPPSWIGVGMDWKIKYKFPKGECTSENCKEFKTSFLKPDQKYRFKADIDYQNKAKT